MQNPHCLASFGRRPKLQNLVFALSNERNFNSEALGGIRKAAIILARWVLAKSMARTYKECTRGNAARQKCYSWGPQRKIPQGHMNP